MGVACVLGIAVVIGGICTESLLAVVVGAGLLILGCIYLVTRVDKVADQATIVRYKEGNDYI